MKRLRLLLVAGLGSLLLSSCTLVATNPSPAHVAKSNVPLGLLNKTIPGTNGARVRFITKPVYIVDATGHLSPSSRLVPSPGNLRSIIEQLLLGPSVIETSVGYTSALPPKLALLTASVRNNIGYINFASPLDTLSVTQQVLAVGQLVLTANAANVGATKGIVVEANGVPQRLLLPNGRRLERASESNFQSLLNP